MEEIQITAAGWRGLTFVNTTPHPLYLQAGDETLRVPHCGLTVSAKKNDQVVGRQGPIVMVKREYIPDPYSTIYLERIEREYPGAIILGSIISAQAYPGRVQGLIVIKKNRSKVESPGPLFRLDKFITFGRRE